MLIHISIDLSIYLCMYQSINLFIYLSIYLSINQSINLSIYQSINQSIYLSSFDLDFRKWGKVFTSFTFTLHRAFVSVLALSVCVWHHSRSFCGLYGVMLLGLPQVMAKRAAYSLKMPLVAWNLLLALFSIVGSYRTLPLAYTSISENGLNHYLCGPEDEMVSISLTVICLYMCVCVCVCVLKQPFLNYWKLLCLVEDNLFL